MSEVTPVRSPLREPLDAELVAAEALEASGDRSQAETRYRELAHTLSHRVSARTALELRIAQLCPLDLEHRQQLAASFAALGLRDLATRERAEIAALATELGEPEIRMLSRDDASARHRPRIVIAGSGPGEVAHLTALARRLALTAEVVATVPSALPADTAVAVIGHGATSGPTLALARRHPDVPLLLVLDGSKEASRTVPAGVTTWSPEESRIELVARLLLALSAAHGRGLPAHSASAELAGVRALEAAHAELRSRLDAARSETAELRTELALRHGQLERERAENAALARGAADSRSLLEMAASREAALRTDGAEHERTTEELVHQLADARAELDRRRQALLVERERVTTLEAELPVVRDAARDARERHTAAERELERNLTEGEARESQLRQTLAALERSRAEVERARAEADAAKCAHELSEAAGRNETQRLSTALEHATQTHELERNDASARLARATARVSALTAELQAANAATSATFARAAATATELAHRRDQHDTTLAELERARGETRGLTLRLDQANADLEQHAASNRALRQSQTEQRDAYLALHSTAVAKDAAIEHKQRELEAARGKLSQSDAALATTAAELDAQTEALRMARQERARDRSELQAKAAELEAVAHELRSAQKTEALLAADRNRVQAEADAAERTHGERHSASEREVARLRAALHQGTEARELAETEARVRVAHETALVRRLSEELQSANVNADAARERATATATDLARSRALHDATLADLERERREARTTASRLDAAAAELDRRTHALLASQQDRARGLSQIEAKTAELEALTQELRSAQEARAHLAADLAQHVAAESERRQRRLTRWLAHSVRIGSLGGALAVAMVLAFLGFRALEQRLTPRDQATTAAAVAAPSGGASVPTKVAPSRQLPAARRLTLTEYAAIEQQSARRHERDGYRITAKLRSRNEVTAWLGYQATVRDWDDATLTFESHDRDGVLHDEFDFANKTYVEVLVENLGLQSSFDVNTVAASFRLLRGGEALRGSVSPWLQPSVITGQEGGGATEVQAITLRLEFPLPTTAPIELEFRPAGLSPAHFAWAELP